MTDRLLPEERSANMSRIRAKDTAPELLVRSTLHRLGYRFRLHRADLPGTPDLVLPKYRIAVFVNGCYWHRHPGCKYAYTPKSNVEFWQSKFAANIQRDALAVRSLELRGWRAMVVWECETKDSEALAQLLAHRVGTVARDEALQPLAHR